jgi:hypothetical protein
MLIAILFCVNNWRCVHFMQTQMQSYKACVIAEPETANPCVSLNRLLRFRKESDDNDMPLKKPIKFALYIYSLTCDYDVNIVGENIDTIQKTQKPY